MFPHGLPFCAVLSKLSQWSSTGPANTFNKNFLNSPLLRIWPTKSHLYMNLQQKQCLPKLSAAVNYDVWNIWRQSLYNETIHKSKACPFWFYYPIYPLGSSLFMQRLFVTLILFVHNWVFCKHILGWQTSANGTWICLHLGVLLMNLFCIASSSAWWASSDCMAAEHSRASMVRIRCSPQPGKGDGHIFNLDHDLVLAHCSVARMHVFNLICTRSPVGPLKNMTFKTLIVHGINYSVMS